MISMYLSVDNLYIYIVWREQSIRREKNLSKGHSIREQKSTLAKKYTNIYIYK